MRISIWSTPVLVVAAVLITFVITAVPILIAGANPIEAYAAFVIVPLTSPFTLLEVLVSATPIMLTGAAVAIAFRAGYWNIGAEGQLLLGAIGAAGVGIVVGDLPPILALPVMIAGGALAGATWALLPALLRVAVRDRRGGHDPAPEPGGAAARQRPPPWPVARPGHRLSRVAPDRGLGRVPDAHRPVAAAPRVPAGAGRDRRRLVRARPDTGRPAAAGRRPEPARRPLRRHQRVARRCWAPRW